MKALRRYLPIIIALGTPLIFIIGVVIFVTIPPIFTPPPQYDFLYASYERVYSVDEDGRLVRNEAVMENHIERFRNLESEDSFSIWRYDMKEHEVRQISFEEASALRLDPDPISPDGFEVEFRRGQYSIFHDLFGGSRQESGIFAHKNSASYQLSIPTTRFGRGHFNDLLGWVIAEDIDE